MEDNFCFCNVSFGERYVLTQKRLKESILKHHPKANLFFWTDSLPPNSLSHDESHYGFKVHAIEFARQQGYTKVIWIDTCAILNKPITELFPIIEENGVLAIQDDVLLHRYSSDHFKKLVKDEIKKEWHLVAGSIYIFDFKKIQAENIYSLWRHFESLGYFGGASSPKEENDGIDKCGHRMDETVLAYCMYSNNIIPQTCDKGKYNQNETSVVLKQHFLEKGDKWYDKL